MLIGKGFVGILGILVGSFEKISHFFLSNFLVKIFGNFSLKNYSCHYWIQAWQCPTSTTLTATDTSSKSPETSPKKNILMHFRCFYFILFFFVLCVGMNSRCGCSFFFLLLSVSRQQHIWKIYVQSRGNKSIIRRIKMKFNVFSASFSCAVFILCAARWVSFFLCGNFGRIFEHREIFIFFLFDWREILKQNGGKF